MPIDGKTGSQTVVDKRHLPYKLDDGIGHRARIGIIALPDDQTIEHELRMIFDLPGVACFVNRLPCAATITPDTLKAMESEITRAAGLILPESLVDVMAYGCTSGSLFIGPETIHKLIHKVHPGAVCTTPIEAATTALEALETCSIALITPYADEINQHLRNHLRQNRFEVPVMGSWNEPVDAKVGRISPESIRKAVLDLGRSKRVDTVFISCTNLRALSILEELENKLDKPVISSNAALGWHCLRLAQVNEHSPHYGRLLSRSI
ncbi:MAG: Asp/Glu racemase [bacterium]|nr:Asp/Glu racemase [bacterium]